MKEFQSTPISGTFGRTLFRYFSIGFILLSLGMVLSAYLVYNRSLQSIENEEAKKLAIVEYVLESFMDDVALDLRIMTEMELFHKFITGAANSNELKPYIEDVCYHLLENKLLYNQLRFINSSGMEMFRIDNNKGTINVVGDEFLQDKSDRYYFQESIILNKGEFYLSPFDLNVEEGKVEVPYRPVIRLAVPVFDDNDTKRGIFIINFSGIELFQQLEEESDLAKGQMFISNKDGYLLQSPYDSINWSFMFPEKQQYTIANLFPDENQRIQSGLHQFYTANGLFSCAKVRPFSHVSDQKLFKVVPDDYEWIITLNIPKNEISWLNVLPVKVFAIVFILLSIFVVIAAYSYSQVYVRKLLAQEQLVQSERALRHSNKTKDQFFSILSHDLRNSASTILTFLEFIDKDYETLDRNDLHRYIKNIQIASYQHHNLLNEILNWARLQLDRKIIEPIQLELTDLFEHQKKKFFLALEKKEIALNLNVPKGLSIWADLDMVSTIFRNLINNAIKFTNQGGEIRIEATRMSEFIEIRVIDNGIGISQDDQKKLFDLLSSFQKPGTNNEPGSGFGLKLVAEMVAKNNGTIRVESELGKGSQFILTFPSSEQRIT